MLMGMFMKGHGKMIKLKEWEYTSTLTGLNTREIGSMTSNKERGSRLG